MGLMTRAHKVRPSNRTPARAFFVEASARHSRRHARLNLTERILRDLAERVRVRPQPHQLLPQSVNIQPRRLAYLRKI